MIKTQLKPIRQDQLVFFPLVGGLLCIIISAILIPLMQSSLPALVPLFYSLPRASERLASRDLLYLLPVSSFVVLVINFLGIVFFTAADKVISRILAFSALLVGILSLYTLLRIIFLIT